jgi:hypothetical protein
MDFRSGKNSLLIFDLRAVYFFLREQVEKGGEKL